MTQQSTPAAKSAAGNAPHSPANRPVRLTAWKLTGLWRASHNNKLVAVKDFDTEKSVFSSKLSTAAFTDQTIGRSYDGAITRLVRIEAKAVGLLTVIAIAAGLTSAALTFENWWARIVGAVSMTFLAFASWGAMRVLRMAPYEQVVSATALEPDGGRAATAAAASVIESMSPTHSNYVVGAIADLRVGGAAALVALVLAVFGIGEVTSKPAEPTQETTVDVVASTTAPGAGAQGASMVPTTVVVTTTTNAAASSTSVDVPAQPSR